MAVENVEDEAVESAASEIEEFLSRSVPIRDVEAVETEEVEARTAGKIDDLHKYEVFYRVKTVPMSKMDVLETRSDVTNHVRDQLLAMEEKRGAPDTMLTATDFPPGNLDKPLVFYVRSVL